MLGFHAAPWRSLSSSSASAASPSILGGLLLLCQRQLPRQLPGVIVRPPGLHVAKATNINHTGRRSTSLFFQQAVGFNTATAVTTSGSGQANIDGSLFSSGRNGPRCHSRGRRQLRRRNCHHASLRRSRSPSVFTPSSLPVSAQPLLHRSRASFRSSSSSLCSSSGGESVTVPPGTADEHDEGKGEDARRDVRITSISPSSIESFRSCPKLFHFRYVMGLKPPVNRATLKGIIVHDVLSRYFDLEKTARGLDGLHELFRTVLTESIAKRKKHADHNELFDSRDDERKWAVECLDLLAKFLLVERANTPEGGEDPSHKEYKMTYVFDSQSRVAEGGENRHASTEEAWEGSDAPGMIVTGIIDRLDRSPDGTLRVVDYKTGKVPNLKYSAAVNERIMNEKFFQLQIYALLVQRVLGETPGEMRLVYLEGPESVTRTFDLKDLNTVEKNLVTIWDDINACVQRDTFPTKTSRLCDWCSFREQCPAFATQV